MRLTSDLGALDELLGGGLLVAELSSPGVEGGGLQGAAVGEGQGPGLGQRAGVDAVEVDAGLLFRLATRQERHSCVKTPRPQANASVAAQNLNMGQKTW